MDRQKRIEAGRIWHVYPDADPDHVIFEGSQSACRAFIRQQGLGREYRTGKMRLGKLIWECPKTGH